MRTSDRSHWDRFWRRDRSPDQVYDNAGRITGEIAACMDVRGLRCLEVGAATARDSALLSRSGALAVGLDYSPAAIDLARGATAGSGLLLVRGDALAMPFRDGAFDLVFHQGVLEHFRDPSPILAENRRVLAEGGTLLVDVPQAMHPFTVMKKILIALGIWFAGWETQFTEASLRRLLSRSGFRPVRAYGRFMSPSLPYRLLREALWRIGIRLPLRPVLVPPLHRVRGRVRARLESSVLGRRLGYVLGVFALREPAD